MIKGEEWFVMQASRIQASRIKEKQGLIPSVEFYKIPNLGEVTIFKVFYKFGSVERIAAASDLELKSIKGVSFGRSSAVRDVAIELIKSKAPFKEKVLKELLKPKIRKKDLLKRIERLEEIILKKENEDA